MLLIHKRCTMRVKNLWYLRLKTIIVTTRSINNMHSTSTVRYEISQSKAIVLSMTLVASSPISLNVLHG